MKTNRGQIQPSQSSFSTDARSVGCTYSVEKEILAYEIMQVQKLMSGRQRTGSLAVFLFYTARPES